MTRTKIEKEIDRLLKRVPELEKENYALAAVACPEDAAIGNEYGTVVCKYANALAEIRDLAPTLEVAVKIATKALGD